MSKDIILAVGCAEREASAVAVLAREAGAEVGACPGADLETHMRTLLEKGDMPRAVVLGTDLPDPLSTARQSYRMAPLVHLVFLMTSERGSALRRRLSIAPRIGTHWSLVEGHGDELSRALSVAMVSTGQRLQYRTTLDRVRATLASPPVTDASRYRSLQLSDRYLSSLLTQAPDAIVSTDVGGIIRSWNRGAERILGYSAHEVVGRSVELLDVPGSTTLSELVGRIGSGVRGASSERHFQRSSGGVVAVDFSLAPVHDEHGALLGVSIIARDITERRRAAAALEEQKERLRVTLASIGDGVITTNEQGGVDYLNAVAESLTGWRAADARGLPLPAVFRIVNETSRAEVENPALKALAEGVIVGLANHTLLIARDGTERPIDDSAAPIRDAEGNVQGAVLVFRDVTEKRRAADALGESERHLRSVLDSMPQKIFTAVPAGHVDYMNPAWLSYSGFRPAQLYGWDWAALVHPDDLERNIQAWQRAIETGVEFELEHRFRRHDGEYRWHLSRACAVRSDSGEVTMWVGSNTDVHDIKEAEEHSRRRSEQLRQLALAGTRISAAQDVSSVLDVVCKEARSLIGARHSVISEASADDPGELTAPLVGGDGRGFGVLRLSDKGEGTFTSDDDAMLVQLAQIASVAVENARLYGELRETDRRKTEFLAMLAHELRNPLAPIRTGIEVLRLSRRHHERFDEIVNTMERHVRYMVRLVDDLLDVGRITQGRLELRKIPTSINDVVNTAIEAVRPTIEEVGHTLTVCVTDERLVVDGDPARLSQVMANLLTNAAKYTPQGGRVTLAVERSGDDAIVSVKDTGVGIPPDMLGRIFEMFTQLDHTLERSHGGLGIGLHLVKQVVEMHGGTIEATSAGPGQGSEFHLRLPIIVASERPTPMTVGLINEAGSGRRVLIADDNRDAADMLATVLQAHGHDVITAYDGASAVDLAEQHRPNLVLLDIGMPKLNGYEAASAIQQHSWSKETIFVALTGWGQEEDRKRSADAGFHRHLVKPVEPAVLRHLIDELCPETP